jgi:DNA helicase-2/ATP-dependent DNA helicase PcrA
MKLDFEKYYADLNKQQDAVNSIDGPVLVLAGPGTGKTQLLALRVANILKNTDVNSNNILCFTYTEAGADAMRQRLVDLIGVEANRVIVCTFHGFARLVMANQPDFFINFGSKIADDLIKNQILDSILDNLDYHNKMSTKTPSGSWVYKRDLASLIEQIKKAGLTPLQFEALVYLSLEEDIVLTDTVLDLLVNANTRSKSGTEIFKDNTNEVIEKLELQKSNSGLITSFIQEAKRAIEECDESKKTTPMTEFKRRWLSKDGDGTFLLTSRPKLVKLRECQEIYSQYQIKLAENDLVDFDDLILNLLEVMRQNPTLMHNLWEQYQYILVDEFQDTNGAQLEIIKLLGSSEVSQGRPNILAVGDDKQAIYAFQGAKLSNILSFYNYWQDTKVISLNKNYRSTVEILELAKHSELKLGSKVVKELGIAEFIELEAMYSFENSSRLKSTSQVLLQDDVHQLVYIASELSKIPEGELKDIAIIAPKHKYLETLAKYLVNKGIAVNYERRDNILKQKHIEDLILLINTIVLIADGKIELYKGYIPEVLSLEMFGINSKDIWDFSWQAKESKKNWLELSNSLNNKSSGFEKISKAINWLVSIAIMSQTSGLESCLDLITGTLEIESPYFNYYISSKSGIKSQYLQVISNLKLLREGLRDFKPELDFLKLSDFNEYLEMLKINEVKITDNNPRLINSDGVNLLGAHKCKGLEFKKVFIYGASEEIWGNKGRDGSTKISLPANMLHLAMVGKNEDDIIRLFYVAITRARQELILLCPNKNSSGKSYSKLGLLDQFNGLEVIDLLNNTIDLEDVIEAESADWREVHYKELLNNKDYLKPLLSKYKLAATHLNNFISTPKIIYGAKDINEDNGRIKWLLNNVLGMPSSAVESTVYGNGIHKAMNFLHRTINLDLKINNLEESLKIFIKEIKKYRLGDIVEQKMCTRAKANLELICQDVSKFCQPGDQSERSFSSENCVFNNVRLSGAIDLITDIDTKNKTLKIIDYKTSRKPPTDWQAKSAQDIEKLQNYKRQLQFYKLLVESSNTFNGYRVLSGELVFLDYSDSLKSFSKLSYDFKEDEYAEFKKLVKNVWQEMMDFCN